MATTKIDARKLVVPALATEKDEEQWWDKNMPQVEDLLLRAMKRGPMARNGRETRQADQAL